MALRATIKPLSQMGAQEDFKVVAINPPAPLYQSGVDSAYVNDIDVRLNHRRLLFPAGMKYQL